MAKRTTSSNASKKSPRAGKSVSTPVRNSAIPRSTAPTVGGNNRSSFASSTTASGRTITHEMIAKRAYEIWQSGKGGTQYDNWVRAERELRAGVK